jgi:hypothetical protein
VNNNTYLIPANTKRGSLIFGLFTKFDLILLGSGVGLTLILIFTIPMNNLALTILCLAPGLTCGFLVLPIPNYHNVITVIRTAIAFFTERRIFIWRGWCFHEYDESEKK